MDLEILKKETLLLKSLLISEAKYQKLIDSAKATELKWTCEAWSSQYQHLSKIDESEACESYLRSTLSNINDKAKSSVQSKTNKNILDLGEFLIFSKDFQIPLNKKKIIEIFKKTSSLRQLPVNFEEFRGCLDKIGVEINNERIHEIKARLKEIRKAEKGQAPQNPQPSEESK